MYPFFFVISLLWLTTTTQPNNTVVSSTTIARVQADSTSPNKGVAQVKELSLPSKRKTKPNKAKVNKTKSTPKSSASKQAKTTAETNTKTKKAPKVAQTKTNKPKEKTNKNTVAKKEKATDKKTAQSNIQGLSPEEELRMLARTEDLSHLEDAVHPDRAENCSFAFDLVDEFTGVQKRGLKARPFFSYTPDEYRKFMKEGDFIRCDGFLSQSSTGNMALNINFYVASSEAKFKFGGIKANSALVLHSMSGKEFYLITYKGAVPQVVDNTTYYQCSFAINKSDIKHLKKAEVDQIKLSFQKGFQSYDVFYLDFMIDQFPCFE